ncbi:N-formylglutamate amidohydrolase [Antarcticibacterium arcticum]|uniref:N-formylglutamate amidohydrolase n=1 Tax=Antarcticibacterium arcticum TaxID=2585771 RepID=A0A5B8YIM2_9FLAO|nr:N-formylglutamate amidohydrolase [Antarcticibacterium arcticum]QED36898.1 N-formylglutamate amidohydrolase [Antarcticibacterium arcticum]
MKLVLTCEHAGNRIPENYRYLCREDDPILQTHRGFDPGALDVYKALVSLADFSTKHLESRLLIEVNRSLHHSSLFSTYTRELPTLEKKKIIEAYYLTYRNRVESAIHEYTAKGEEVLHFSVHSFTPQLKGEIRNTDIGLLYDPRKAKEKEFCKIFKKHIEIQNPSIKVRFNYPYLGKADGFTTYLRKKFPHNYCGVELEVNQKFVSNNKMEKGIKSAILEALQKSIK